MVYSFFLTIPLYANTKINITNYLWYLIKFFNDKHLVIALKIIIIIAHLPSNKRDIFFILESYLKIAYYFPYYFPCLSVCFFPIALELSTHTFLSLKVNNCLSFSEYKLSAACMYYN